MIWIYALKIDSLPSAKVLEKQVVIEVGNEKRAAWSRRSDRGAKESVVGILLLQYAIQQAGYSPTGVLLAYETKGRPFFQDVDLDFSISHRNGVVVCAIEQRGSGVCPRIGVDVETVQDRSADSMSRNAARWFTERERKLFSEDGQERTFLRIWTGKEALSKRTGVGLSEVSQWDVTDLPKDLRLTVYEFENGVISLCHRLDAAPTENVTWIKNGETLWSKQ